jgi:hypothetical protein
MDTHFEHISVELLALLVCESEEVDHQLDQVVAVIVHITSHRLCLSEQEHIDRVKCSSFDGQLTLTQLTVFAHL